jgi:hypothetical protein
MLAKEMIHQEDITIVNTGTKHLCTHFAKQTLLNIKAQRNTNKIIVGEFKTSLSPIHRSYRQKKLKRKLQN